jgi:hypothetical protein
MAALQPKLVSKICSSLMVASPSIALIFPTLWIMIFTSSTAGNWNFFSSCRYDDPFVLFCVNPT